MVNVRFVVIAELAKFYLAAKVRVKSWNSRNPQLKEATGVIFLTGFHDLQDEQDLFLLRLKQ
jgi:hypothetical protein